MKFERCLSALAACLLLAAAAGCGSRRPARTARPATPAAEAPSEAAPPAEAPPAEAPPAEAPPAEAPPAEAPPAPAPAEEPKPAEPQPAPAEGQPAPAPAEEPKPAEPQPAPAEPQPAPAPAEEPKPAQPRTPVEPPRMEEPKGPGGGFDAFMRRTGRSIEETKFLGMRLRPYFSEEIGFTDNVFYQDEDERFVIYKDPDLDGINALEGDGIDNDADGLVDEVGESLSEPSGEVSEVFSNLNVGLGMDLPLNSALLTALGQTGQSIQVFKADLNYIEYFKETDSPDAFNVNGHIDVPFLLRLAKDFNRNAFYVRAEGDYSQVTDPLDVAKFQFSGTNPTLDTVDARFDFTRTEWWAKGTAGWKGARFDAKASARLYEMTLDDDDLQAADHTEAQFYAEIGYGGRGETARYYVFGELTMFDFDKRDENTALRDFDKQRAGAGWEGPFLSKKVKAKLEGYYLNQEIEEDDKGPFLLDANGVARPFDDFSGPGGLARLTYRPFVTKPTEIQVEYSKDFTWSVVAEHKEVDQAYVSLSHPINEKLSTQVRYSVTQEKVSHREHRIFQEAGLRLSYKIAAYTDVYFQYTLRHMDSQNEMTSQFADAINEPFLVRADGDFIANIASVGISIRF